MTNSRRVRTAPSRRRAQDGTRPHAPSVEPDQAVVSGGGSSPGDGDGDGNDDGDDDGASESERERERKVGMHSLREDDPAAVRIVDRSEYDGAEDVEQEARESGARRQVPGDTEVAEVSDADPGNRLAPLARRSDGSPPGGPVRDAVGRFMAEVRNHPRLSEEEERELGRLVRNSGDRNAARRLVVHNLRLVVAIAHQYRRAWANILDLFQEGSVGLMEAVKRWEPTLGPRFGSYAAYWIRAYVLKFLMTNSRLIHVGNTRAGRKLFFRLERERQKLMAGGFEPTPKLLAAKLDVDEHDLDEVSRHLDSREISFDPPASGTDGEEGYSLSERIPVIQASPEDHAATAEMSDALHEVMNDFSSGLTDERERAVWRDHLASGDPVPLGEIGIRFGVSKQRMGQIADNLKKRFRERIVARMGPDIQTDWLGDEQ
jgi:RNA polymerase sigma-32 factor